MVDFDGEIVVDVKMLVKAKVSGGLVVSSVKSTVIGVTVVSGLKFGVEVVSWVIGEGISVVVEVVSSNAEVCVVETMSVVEMELEDPTVVQ